MESVFMAPKRKVWLQILSSVLITLLLLAAGAGGWYYYDSHVDRSGWVMLHDQYYYRDFHNHNVTGWQDLENARYYFDESGVMQLGWLQQGDDRYYLDSDGTMVTGWMNRDGHRYHLGADGILDTGLLEDQGKFYILGEDGHVLRGFQTVGDHTYYLTEDGSAAVGPVTVREHNYYFSQDGIMQTGWAELPDGKHYYLEDGTMAYGFQEIEGKTYYLEAETGLPHTGWLTDEEYQYYFGEDGAAYTGPREIEGKKYHFTPKGISVMLVNASNPIPKDYDPQLVTLTGWHQISKVALNPMKKMLSACKLAGKEPAINSIYRSGKNQDLIMEDRIEQFIKDGLSKEEAAAKAATIVAARGTSEHETGLSADLVGEEAKKWLGEHCWEYGFILRYPPEKSHITGITSEPWHFRYVGPRVSMDMKDTGLCLEEYLGAGPAKP